MKQIKNFFSSKWTLLIPLLVLRLIAFCNAYYVIFNNFTNYAVFLVFVYFLIGVVFLPKIKEKKKALIIAILCEWGINITILMGVFITVLLPYLLGLPFCKLGFHLILCFHTPLSLLAYHYLDESTVCLVICTLLSPASVGFVYLFSKIPLLFQFLKRIRIKKSGKSITFYLKDVETKQ